MTVILSVQLNLGPAALPLDLLDISTFAATHYAMANTVSRVSVVWVATSNMGPVRISRTISGGTWSRG